MDLISALKTGRRIRRPNWGTKLYAGWLMLDDGLDVELGRSDILADDWEVEPAPLTLAEVLKQAELYANKGCDETRNKWRHILCYRILELGAHLVPGSKP